MNSMMISAKQIKAARALLDWGQNDLATAASLSVTTIRNLESDCMSPRGTTLQTIREAMESAGVEFTDGEGVRCRNDEIKAYQGIESCDTFLDDMIRAVGKSGGDVEIVVPSYPVLLQICGILADDRRVPLAEISRVASIKCLLSEMPRPSGSLPAIEFRLTAKQNILPLPFVIYDNRCAFALVDGGSSPRFATLRVANGARVCRLHFHTHWEAAQPLYLEEHSFRRLRAL